MNYTTRFLKWVKELPKWIGALGMVGMIVVIMTNVLSRIFSYPIVGSIEMVEVLAVLMGFGALIHATSNKGHISVSFLTSRLPQRSQLTLEAVSCIIGMILCALMAWSGVLYSWKQWKIGEATQMVSIPLVPFRYILALAWTIMCLILCLLLLSLLSRRFRLSRRQQK